MPCALVAHGKIRYLPRRALFRLLEVLFFRFFMWLNPGACGDGDFCGDHSPRLEERSPNCDLGSGGRDGDVGGLCGGAFFFGSEKRDFWRALSVWFFDFVKSLFGIFGRWRKLRKSEPLRKNRRVFFIALLNGMA